MNARGACEALAHVLVHDSVHPDPKRAVKLYEPACDAGSASACDALGALLAAGHGGDVKRERIVGLYKRACDAHWARGCVDLGSLYFSTGVPADEKHGTDLFRVACDGGEPTGCQNLSVAYRSGHGVDQSDAKASEFAAKATALKSASRSAQ